MPSKPDGGPAFPIPAGADWGETGGMSLREFACIQLCVPETGTPWLDKIIRRALHDRLAGQAMAGLVQDTEAQRILQIRYGEDEKLHAAMAVVVCHLTDALLAELNKEGESDANN